MKQFVVIGLGRFGSSVAKTLHSMGCQILAIDIDEEKVQSISNDSTRAVQCDATDEKALRSIGARNFDVAVVTVGDLQSSILITLMLKELGLPYVVTKAHNELHAKILYRLGADKVVTPEHDMGFRLAHNLVASNILEYIEISPRHSIVEILPPQDMLHHSLKELDLRRRFGVNVMAIKDGEDINLTPTGKDVIGEKHVLVVIGKNEDLKRIQEF